MVVRGEPGVGKSALLDHLAEQASGCRVARVAGALVLPASPGFYHRPQRIEELIDFVVGRVLSQLGIQHSLGPHWQSGEAD